MTVLYAERQVVKLLMDNVKSLFVTPASGTNVTRGSALRSLDYIHKHITFMEYPERVLLVGEGRRYDLAHLLSLENNYVLTIDMLRDRHKRHTYMFHNGGTIPVPVGSDIRKFPVGDYPHGFDYIISIACLEHIHRVERALEVMVDLLQVPFGKMLHGVDLSPHAIFDGDTRIIDRIPGWLWTAMTSHSGKVNRRGATFYQNVLESLGCNVQITPTPHGISILADRGVV